jgi:hypothetical protein
VRFVEGDELRLALAVEVSPSGTAAALVKGILELPKSSFEISPVQLAGQAFHLIQRSSR